MGAGAAALAGRGAARRLVMPAIVRHRPGPDHGRRPPRAAVALANKECLVCAGPLFIEAARAHGAAAAGRSEHNAIFQVLTHPERVEKLTLTAWRAVPRRQPRSHGRGHARSGLRPSALEHGAQDLRRQRHPDEQGARTYRGVLSLWFQIGIDRRDRASRKRGAQFRPLCRRLGPGSAGLAGHAHPDRLRPDLAGPGPGLHPELDLAQLARSPSRRRMDASGPRSRRQALDAGAAATTAPSAPTKRRRGVLQGSGSWISAGSSSRRWRCSRRRNGFHRKSPISFDEVAAVDQAARRRRSGGKSGGSLRLAGAPHQEGAGRKRSNAGRVQGLRDCWFAGSFVIVLSVVVFVHEFGHFRWRAGAALNRHLLHRFRQDPVRLARQAGQWKVGALPLGGYVKFADDADADVDCLSERSRTRRPSSRRARVISRPAAVE